MNSIRAFREAWMSADLVYDETAFGSFDARKLRYTLYWAMYENSAYRSLHRWAHAYKVNYGLYRHIRAIYNPAYRLGEFWKTHLWGGNLDLKAGSDSKTALPIQTEHDAVRLPISQLWRWSNWQINKDITTLWGAILGDAAIRVIDDTDHRKVYLKNVHPSTLKSIDLDPFGNVKGYEIVETRTDPERPDRKAEYSEVCTRDDEYVQYATYKDNVLYAWEDNGTAEWAEPYGFVPLVVIQHNNIGLEWGWSEYHAAHEKFREVDDLASKLSDQVRKMVDAAWLFSGVSKPTRGSPSVSGPDSTPPDRDDLPAIYGPVGSNAIPLVAPLDIASTSAYIAELLKILEQDYPELSVDIHNVGGDISGRALLINQRPAEKKVEGRRPNYDDALVRVQQMAVAIGGWRGYSGFQGFDLDSYAKGDLDHQIAPRPVFAEDRLTTVEYEILLWQAAREAKASGVPIDLFLEEHGWSSSQIARILASPEHQAHLAGLNQIAMLGDTRPEGRHFSRSEKGQQDE